MAKLLLICYRDPSRHNLPGQFFDALNRRLAPDNIVPAPAKVLRNEGVVTAIFNPNGAVTEYAGSVCLGAMFSPPQDWYQPGSPVPDGNFAMVRTSPAKIELLTDFLANRSLWYFFDSRVLIASTSQRAIVTLLGSFEPESQVAPWMLSTGTLGPFFSWDQRVRLMQRNSILTLDRASWSLNLQESTLEYAPESISDIAHRQRLDHCLHEVLGSLEIDPDRWVMSLSGGYDSRAILLGLKNPARFKCVTWGKKAALKDSKSDAVIAQRLAQAVGAPHEYYETDVRAEEPFESVINRFLVAGEGRVDQIRGYMDGFKIWKDLYEAGIEGVIRGDEAFGTDKVYSHFHLLRWLNLLTLSDFQSHARFASSFDSPPQMLPPQLQRRTGENLTGWSDRLRLMYSQPVEIAALNDLKTAFVEIANPLISRRLVPLALAMPENLRSSKRAFKQVVDRWAPHIPIAKHNAVEDNSKVYRLPAMRALVEQSLNSPQASKSLPPDLVAFLNAGLHMRGKIVRSKGRLLRWKHSLKDLIPNAIRSHIREYLYRPKLDRYRAGFRAMIIIRMHEMLTADAAEGSSWGLLDGPDVKA